MSAIAHIEKVVPENVALPPAERRAVLEIAFLSVAADHTINEDEEVAFRALAKRVAGASEGEREAQALLSKFDGHTDREDADARLRTLAKELTSPGSRELAYKMAYTLALADLASSDQEFEFDLQLIDALGLEQETVDRLTEEVMTALDPG